MGLLGVGGGANSRPAVLRGFAFSSRRKFCSERDWTGLRVDSTVGEGIRLSEQACFP